VCLRCRHAARTEARERAQRLMLRGTAVAIVIATFVTATAYAFHKRSLANDSSAASKPADSTTSASVAAVDSTPLRDTTPIATPALAGQPTAPAAIEPAKPPFEPVVAHGQSALADGAVAVRGDSDVVVTFDNQTLRTRRADKFEQVVRATLTAVYGAPMKQVLSSMPVGAIAQQGELLTELTTRGVRIPVDGAWMVRLVPETRPGQDGPLVIRYRARLAPIN
jgi:hypothetical protein